MCVNHKPLLGQILRKRQQVTLKDSLTVQTHKSPGYFINVLQNRSWKLFQTDNILFLTAKNVIFSGAMNKTKERQARRFKKKSLIHQL